MLNAWHCLQTATQIKTIKKSFNIIGEEIYVSSKEIREDLEILFEFKNSIFNFKVTHASSTLQFLFFIVFQDMQSDVTEEGRGWICRLCTFINQNEDWLQ